MKNKLFLNCFCFLVVHVICTTQLHAIGVLFNRPLGSNQQYNKMWIKSVDVDVAIQDQVSVTHVDQVFYNELGTQVEAVYIFPLPENAVITELVYWFNGVRYVANIRERQQARQDYENKIRQYLDPALLEYLGDNLFRLSIAPINAYSEVHSEITYVELLDYDFGSVNYEFLLNTTGLSPKPLQHVSLAIEARSQYPFKNFTSPTHKTSTATQITQLSDHFYTVFFGDENFYPDKNFELQYETIRDDIQFNVLTYTPAPEDSFGRDSFYALWITPPDSIAEDKLIPKDIIFTADVSSSMEGIRIQQLKEALDFFLDLLHPIDRFNIITFGTFVEKFQPDLVSATNDNISLAHDFVFQMYALGMTNINEALTASLTQSFGDSTSNDLIFLTDGNPTFGETHIDSILVHAGQNNTKDVRIFTFGIGENLSQPMLIRIARENHGYPTFITSDDSIALVVNNHFTRISKPVLADIAINFDELQVWDFYPKKINDLYWGSQTLQRGLYTNSGLFNVTLSGNVRSNSVFFSKQITFSDTLGGHRFVPRLWAKAKIDYLLELINTYGETDELVNQIIELSMRFQILTPYTAFYADPETNVKTQVFKPEKFVLFQNYPNPFNSQTEIKYSLPVGKTNYHVVLRIYDVLGRLVKILVDKEQPSGAHSVNWDGKDFSGNSVVSGVYFYSLEVGEFKITKKMLVLE
jgi:Ca-activated chloride channel homolog